jgi:hypothetical protein
MNVEIEIGTEALQFPEKEYINEIFVAVCNNICLQDRYRYYTWFSLCFGRLVVITLPIILSITLNTVIGPPPHTINTGGWPVKGQYYKNFYILFCHQIAIRYTVLAWALVYRYQVSISYFLSICRVILDLYLPAYR